MVEWINTRGWALAAVVAIALAFVAFPARAQVDPLPDPCKVAGFSAEEQQQIATFVERRLTAIAAEDQEARERARKELLAPLTRPCVSVAFRQIYRGAMIGRLTELAGVEDERIAITALVLLGELADDPARQVLQQYTADARPTVRYAAISGLNRTFRAIDVYAPALDSGRATSIVVHLGERLAAEEDPQILDLIVRSLVTALQISRDGYAETSSRAATALAEGIGQRLREAGPEARPVVLISVLRVGEAFGNRLVGGGNAPAEVSRAAAAYSGEVLAHLAQLANAGLLPEARQVEIDIANIAERVIVFAHQKLGRSISPPGLSDLLQAGEDREFYGQVRQLVLALDQAPLSLSPETMARIRDALEGG